MAQASEDGSEGLALDLEDVTPDQLAGISVFGAVLTGGLFSVIGLQLDLRWYDAALVLTGILLLVLIAIAFAVMRAMVISATVDDDNPVVALTNPLFVVLFLLIAIGVSVFVGVYTAI